MGITKAERYNKRPFGPKTNTQIVKLESEGSTGKTFDLMKMNLEDIANELNYYLTKGEPITLWGRDRDNNKINLNTEKIRKLSSQLMAMRNMGEELAKFKASVLLHDDYINGLVGDYFTKAKRTSEIEEEQHTYTLQEILRIGRMKKIEEERAQRALAEQEALTDRIKAENEAIRMKSQIENIKAQSEVKLKEARTIREIELTAGISKILDNIDFSSIPKMYQTLLISFLYKPTDSNIMNKVEDLMKAGVFDSYKDDFINSKKAEAARDEAQANNEKSHYQYNTDQFKKKMGNN